MEPTLLPGDYLFVEPLKQSPGRSQLIVFNTVFGPYVQRFVGLPGDTLSMRNGVVFVNGRELKEPYANRSLEGLVEAVEFRWQADYLVPGLNRALYRPSLTTWGPIIVPIGRYFALGDNRGASADSRYRGFVADTAVIGEPVLVYFSRDRDTGKIRWKRFGTDPRKRP
jgi:signal peptidase I